MFKKLNFCHFVIICPFNHINFIYFCSQLIAHIISFQPKILSVSKICGKRANELQQSSWQIRYNLNRVAIISRQCARLPSHFRSLYFSTNFWNWILCIIFDKRPLCFCGYSNYNWLHRSPNFRLYFCVWVSVMSAATIFIIITVMRTNMFIIYGIDDTGVMSSFILVPSFLPLEIGAFARIKRSRPTVKCLLLKLTDFRRSCVC